MFCTKPFAPHSVAPTRRNGLGGNQVTSMAWATGGRSALPGEWRRRRPAVLPESCVASAYSPRGAWLPPVAIALVAAGYLPEGTASVVARWSPRPSATGRRSALPGEWRRSRPAVSPAIVPAAEEPFGLHSPRAAWLPPVAIASVVAGYPPAGIGHTRRTHSIGSTSWRRSASGCRRAPTPSRRTGRRRRSQACSSRPW